jgi:hypothetical protein
VGVLIIANLANFDEGGKTGLEGGKNILHKSLVNLIFKKLVIKLYLILLKLS